MFGPGSRASGLKAKPVLHRIKRHPWANPTCPVATVFLVRVLNWLQRSAFYPQGPFLERFIHTVIKYQLNYRNGLCEGYPWKALASVCWCRMQLPVNKAEQLIGIIWQSCSRICTGCVLASELRPRCWCSLLNSERAIWEAAAWLRTIFCLTENFDCRWPLPVVCLKCYRHLQGRGHFSGCASCLEPPPSSGMILVLLFELIWFELVVLMCVLFWII